MRSARVRSARFRLTPNRSAPDRIASVRSASVNLASIRFAPVRFAFRRTACVRSPSLSSALVRFAPVRFAPIRFARLRFAPERFAPVRSTPARSTSDRSRRDKSAFLRVALSSSSRSWAVAGAPSTSRASDSASHVTRFSPSSSAHPYQTRGAATTLSEKTGSAMTETRGRPATGFTPASTDPPIASSSTVVRPSNVHGRTIGSRFGTSIILPVGADLKPTITNVTITLAVSTGRPELPALSTDLRGELGVGRWTPRRGHARLVTGAASALQCGRWESRSPDLHGVNVALFHLS